jgi:hypothetical protein
LLKSKKYLVPLAILSPYTACGVGVAYLTGRFNPKKNAEIFDIASAVQPRPRDASTVAESDYVNQTYINRTKVSPYTPSATRSTAVSYLQTTH